MSVIYVYTHKEEGRCIQVEQNNIKEAIKVFTNKILKCILNVFNGFLNTIKINLHLENVFRRRSSALLLCACLCVSLLQAKYYFSLENIFICMVGLNIVWHRGIKKL